jgi:hypothetical protein
VPEICPVQRATLNGMYSCFVQGIYQILVPYQHLSLLSNS